MKQLLEAINRGILKGLTESNIEILSGLDDDELRAYMSKNGVEHIINDFDSKKLIGKIIENRDYLLSRKNKKR